MKLKILFFFILCLPFGLLAQNEWKLRSFQLDAGINQIKEENLHPKVHKGLIYGLQFEHLKYRKRTTSWGMGLQFSRLKTKYEDLSASANAQLFARYAKLFPISQTPKRSWLLGPEANLHYVLSFFPNWDESHLYWANTWGAGIHNKFIFQIKEKRSLDWELRIPLVSLLSRPEPNRLYKIDDLSAGGIISSLHSNLEGAFWNKSLMIWTKVEYQFQISEKTTQALCYSFEYARIKSKEGAPFQNLQHHVGLKIYF